jgi:rare lipoprotein A
MLPTLRVPVVALTLAVLATPAAPRELASARIDRAPAPRASQRSAVSAPADLGKASWYGAWHHGRRTASGERFNMWALTAAHRTLPLGTHVRVTNLRNGRSVDVRVNDRGPIYDDRIIDLSRGAAARLGAETEGVVPVRIVVLERNEDGISPRDTRED